MAQKLSDDEIELALKELQGWALVADGKAIEKQFTFKGFNSAFGFMTRVALASERSNHHPEWSNIYNQVTIRWTTHSSDGLTDLDLRLARSCEKFVSD